jgi:hypothetical protein
MGEEEIGHGAAGRRNGRVLVGRVKCGRLHDATSVGFQRRRECCCTAITEMGEPVHNLGDVGMGSVMTGSQGWGRMSRVFGLCSYGI